jgi:hypothetical protein
MLTAAMGSGFRNSRNWLCSRDFGLSGLGIMEDRAIRWGLKSLFVYISIIITTTEALWLFEIFSTSTYTYYTLCWNTRSYGGILIFWLLLDRSLFMYIGASR